MIKKWIEEGARKAREEAMYIAGIHRMSRDERLAFADKSEKAYIKGATGIK